MRVEAARRSMGDEATVWDAIICGGGMAGLCLARQLHLELPRRRVLVVERTRRPLPPGTHKVGESNAELGSLYLEQLGLREYLRERHVVKLGLRFFPGSGDRPLDARTEIGPSQEPIVRGYQIDRGRFEQDLRAMVEDDGVVLWEGAMVRAIQLADDDEPHTVVVERDGDTHPVRVRWVVDASGRSGLLRRRFGSKTGTRHVGNAAWFRVQGRVHPAELAAAAAGPWHDVPLSSQRWRSTNHFMGDGYWIWMIALPEARTSIGVVTFDAAHGFDRIRTLDRALDFLHAHEPALAERLAQAQALDFRCIKGYSHGVARSLSHRRWAIVGDAGAFVDPLYSPGTDFIALSNTFAVEMIRADAAGEPLEARADALDAQYQALVEGSLGVYRQSAPVYAHPRAMAAKVYWDNFAYWSYTCQYFLQRIYRERGELPRAVDEVRARFVELSGYVQSLLRAWATAHPERPEGTFMALPSFPSYAVDAHLDLQKTLTPAQTLALMRERAEQGEQMVAELVVRLLLEYGPDAGPRLLDVAGFAAWDLRLDPERAAAEPTTGLARRRAVSRVVRDVERALGRVDRHSQWEAALARLLPPRREPA